METPLLCPFGVTDPYIESFECEQHFLQTSPEYAMKRLLVNGSGSIYQIGKAFRKEEAGRWHRPEFSMLEWYRLDFDHHQLMQETSSLLQTCLNCPPCEKISYQNLFEQHVDIEPHSASITDLKNVIHTLKLNIHNANSIDDKDTLLQLILSEHIEAKLGFEQPVIIYDYPESQSALAKVRHGKPSIAERFEIYINGLEIANGFHELQDAKEQERRFKANQKTRKQLNLTPMAIDQGFLNALEKGLPACSGIALGLDRLLMCKMNVNSIDAVMAL